ncbi:MAG: plastocyanin/azurin family copper-binding protein [Salinivenus sp.]
MADRTNEYLGDAISISRRDFLQHLGVFGILGLGASTLTAASGSGDWNRPPPSADAVGSVSERDQLGTGGDVARTVTLHPEGNQMKYKETEFSVRPGEEVKIVFENTATTSSMKHNIVVLNGPPEQSNFRKVGQAGMNAGSSNEYVPDSMDLVLAHTPIAEPGETVSVTFNVPSKPGDYGYVCTFPGHWTMMNGTMHVTE